MAVMSYGISKTSFSVKLEGYPAKPSFTLEKPDTLSPPLFSLLTSTPTSLLVI
jgi:hypothetical protein